MVQIDFDGSIEPLAQIEVNVDVPSGLFLSEAYPNPFNPSTSITLGVSEDGPVQVDLYNSQGQLVRSVFEGTMSANTLQIISIDASDLTSGYYLVKVETANDVKTRSILLTK